MPLRHRHAYAAGIQRGLRADDLKSTEEFPAHYGRVRVAVQPRSARFELAGRLRGVQTLVSHVHLPVSFAGPGPSDSAGPSRLCRGCLPPNRSVPTSRAAPNFTSPLRRTGGGVLSSPHGSQRLVALQVTLPMSFFESQLDVGWP